MARGPLKLPVIVEHWDSRAVVIVTVGPDAVAEWLLHLCLLRYGLASSVTVVDSGGSTSRLWLGLEPGNEPGGRFRWSADGPLVYVTGAAIDYWISFFLDYYTTGRSPVDHIDVLPYRDRSEGGEDLQVVLQLRQRGEERASQQAGHRRSRKR